MFDLINAGSGVKKAAYRKGIRSGNYEPIFDRREHVEMDVPRKVARVVGDNGKEVILDEFDVDLAMDYTWKEIRGGA